MMKQIESLKIVKSVVRACLIAFIIAALSACATNGIMGFGDPLATSSYVDTADAASQERIAQTEEELQKLTEEMEAMQSDVETLKNIQVNLDEMPKEMIRQLVEALQSYLDMMEEE